MDTKHPNQRQSIPSSDNADSSSHDVPPPPTYAQALKGVPPAPVPHRQLSLPGDEPSHPALLLRGGLGYPANVQGNAIYPVQRGAGGGGGGSNVDWVPPPNETVGKARARRRFFVAFLWAVGIYLLVGMLLGGSIEDARQQRHRHRRNDPSYPPFGKSTDSEIVRGTRTWRRVPKQTEVAIELVI